MTVLEDDDIFTLRTPEPSDAPAVAAAVRASIDKLYPWMPWATTDYDETAALAWVNNEFEPDGHPFVIEIKATKAIAGTCGLGVINTVNHYVNLGYWLQPEYTGMGLATRATRLLAHHANERLGVHRVEILMATGNEPSRRVAERAGATYEGKLRGRLLLRGEYHDAHLFSILPSDSAYI